MSQEALIAGLAGFQFGGQGEDIMGASLGMLGGILATRKDRADRHREAAERWQEFVRDQWPMLRLSDVVGDYQSGTGLEGATEKPNRNKPPRTPNMPRPKRKRRKR